MTDLVSGGASVVNVTLKIAQTIYELKAVGEKAEDLLQTINSIRTDLSASKELLHIKSQQLEPQVRKWIENNIRNAKKAIDSIADLVEDTRADKQVNSYRAKGTKDINFTTRIVFYIVESPKVMERSQRMLQASQGLYAALITLSQRNVLDVPESGMQRNRSHRPSSESRSPPTYYESEFWRRKGKFHSLIPPPPPSDGPEKPLGQSSPEEFPAKPMATFSDRVSFGKIDAIYTQQTPSSQLSLTTTLLDDTWSPLNSQPSLDTLSSSSSTNPFRRPREYSWSSNVSMTAGGPFDDDRILRAIEQPDRWSVQSPPISGVLSGNLNAPSPFRTSHPADALDDPWNPQRPMGANATLDRCQRYPPSTFARGVPYPDIDRCQTESFDNQASQFDQNSPQVPLSMPATPYYQTPFEPPFKCDARVTNPGHHGQGGINTSNPVQPPNHTETAFTASKADEALLWRSRTSGRSWLQHTSSARGRLAPRGQDAPLGGGMGAI